jgi:hypothetical protein
MLLVDPRLDMKLPSRLHHEDLTGSAQDLHGRLATYFTTSINHNTYLPYTYVGASGIDIRVVLQKEGGIDSGIGSNGLAGIPKFYNRSNIAILTYNTQAEAL